MPTAQQYQNLVIASLSAADPSAQIDLSIRVPLYWNLYVLKARWPDVRFWYTYRECVMLLMGRMRMQIDTVRRNSRASGDMQSDASTDGHTTASASSTTSETGNSTSLHSLHKQNDMTMVSGNGSGGAAFSNFSSRRQLTSSQHHDDTGEGQTAESSYLYRNSNATRSHYTTDNQGSKGTTIRTMQSANNVDFHDYSTHFNSDTLSHTARLLEADTQTQTFKTLNTDIQTETSGYVAGGTAGGLETTVDNTHSTSGHSGASSRFNSNVSSGSTIVSDPNISKSDGASLLVEHTGDTASTHGTLANGLASQLTTRTNKTNGATGATTTRDSSVALSNSLQQSATHFQMQKLQQKFKHLDELWKEASKRIVMLEQQATITERYQVNAMATQFVTDYPDTTSAALANAPWLRGFENCVTLISFPF